MPYMFVTLDVSRLSGWLNADAPCRVTTELTEGDMRGHEGVRVEAVDAACTEGPTGHWGHGTRAGAHLKHSVHVRDAGRVEAHRLVER